MLSVNVLYNEIPWVRKGRSGPFQMSSRFSRFGATSLRDKNRRRYPT